MHSISGTSRNIQRIVWLLAGALVIWTATAHKFEIIMDAEEPPTQLFRGHPPMTTVDGGGGIGHSDASATSDGGGGGGGGIDGGRPIGQCSIEYQETRSEGGWCQRIGRSGARACVSESHMVPFHPDCMM